MSQHDVHARCERHSADAVKGIERDVREPLLIDPGSTMADDGQLIVMWQTVLDNLPAAEHVQPAVGHDLGAEEHEQRARKASTADQQWPVFPDEVAEPGEADRPAGNAERWRRGLLGHAYFAVPRHRLRIQAHGSHGVAIRKTGSRWT